MQMTLRRMSSKIAPAKIVSQRSHVIPGKLKVTEHFFEVPTDYSKPDNGETIRIFARSARKHETPVIPDTIPEKQQLPLMCYLQGGPGGACGPPQSAPLTQTVLDKGYEILYLDQRGTGLSTPITASTLHMRGSVEDQARYLKLFRADNIVRDCEAVRQALTAEYPENKKQWSTIAQSFGGFITLTYLSFHPEGLRECFIFGGLAPISAGPDEVYRRCYRKVIERNEAYYRKFPEDVERVKTIVGHLQQAGSIKLPSDGDLTPRRFRELGLAFGAHGGLDTVHDIVLRAAYDLEAFGHLTRPALSAIDRALGFDEGILYAVLHEPIYCQAEASNWAADRVIAEYPVFSLDKTDDKPVYFTGEMIFPSMFEDYSELRQVKDVAHRIASDTDWPMLYDEKQLAKNEVPVYAASYIEDMFVDYDLGMQTAKKVKGCKVFSTNVMYHNAVRSKTEEVCKQAFALRDDVLD